MRTAFSKFGDITDRKERKRELRTLKGQYQSLVENFPNGAVVLYDTDLCRPCRGRRTIQRRTVIRRCGGDDTT
jgi:PAS domain-containing protein